MSGPWEQYAAPSGSKGPWSAYEPPKPNIAKDVAKSALTGLSEGLAAVKGQVGDVQQGFGRNLDAVATVTNQLLGRKLPPSTVFQNMNPNASTGQLNAQRQARSGADYQPQTRAGEVTRTAGQFAPNALLSGGGFIPRAAAVVLPTIGAELAGEAARGTAAEPYARAGGAIVGGVVAGGASGLKLNDLMPRGRPAAQVATNALRRNIDLPTAQARANSLRAAGAEPTFASVTDESGRGLIRAAASRNTPSREVVQRRAEASALNLPDRIGKQARANMSSDPRTPAQIASKLGKERKTAADAAFGAVRGEPIQLAPEGVQALRNPLGREAIAEAAKRERDPEVRAALNRLAENALDDPSTPITVGMADRISRTLLGKARETRDPDLAATYTELGKAIRDPAKAASTGYGKALEGYSAQSKLIEAADHGEDFLKRNTDEFVAQTPGVGQPGNDLARATGRRAIERAAGENISSAPGVANRLAFAPEQQARNRHLLGDEGAQRLQAGMAGEARTNADLQYVAPKTGSQTELRTADQQAAGKVVDFAQTMLGGPKAIVAATLNRLKTLGLNDEQAGILADAATDPAKLDELLTLIAKQPGGARYVPLIRDAVVGGQRAGQAALSASSATQ